MMQGQTYIKFTIFSIEELRKWYVSYVTEKNESEDDDLGGACNLKELREKSCMW